MSQLFYEICIDGSSSTLWVERPEKLPQAGDILVFTKSFKTPGGGAYDAGDELHLLNRTDEAPFGRRSSLGNWEVFSKLGCLVWSNIEWMLETGVVTYLDAVTSQPAQDGQA